MHKFLYPTVCIISFIAGIFIGQCDFVRDRLEFTENIESGKELSKSEKKFKGRYNIVVGPYKGRLAFYKRKSGHLGGYIKFSNWGNKQKEYLKSIKVRGSSVSFVRSCTGAYCAKIGSHVPFKQTYRGDLKGRSISGSYIGNRSGGKWSAKR